MSAPPAVTEAQGEAIPERPKTDEPAAQSAGGQKVDPWNVQGEVAADGTLMAINYKKLTEEFGTKMIDDALLKRFTEVTGHQPHRFLRRGIVFSHRELEVILDRHERGEPFYLYTGRGPSSDGMHLGHVTPFMFTKWLQDVFDCPLIIMLTDDEKYYFSESRTIEQVQKYAKENTKDIIAIGFDPDKTFIFSDYGLFEEGAPGFYKNVTRIAKRVTYNQAKAIFGFNESSSIGKIHFASIQAATAFASSFPFIFGEDEKITSKIPCLIPCAIDQDPYFRMTRDVAVRIPLAKPSLLHSRFLDALQGPGTKMSASVESSAVFLTDTPKQIKTKINKHAFSGGRETVEEHRAMGGNPDVDVSYGWLQFFLEDDEELQKLYDGYKKGEILTGELKQKCIATVTEYVEGFQQRRAAVDDDVVKLYMTKRQLKWGGNPNAKKPEPTKQEVEASQEADAAKGPSKNELKKQEKLRKAQEKKDQKAAEKAAKAQGDAPVSEGKPADDAASAPAS